MQQETKGEAMKQNRRSVPQASALDAQPIYQRNNAQRKQGNGDCGGKNRRAQPKLSAGSKQQAPTPQDNIPSMRNKASVSIGVAQRNNRIGVRKAVQVHLRMAYHAHRKAHHQQFCVADEPVFHLGKTRFLCQQFSFLPQNNLPMLWENRGRYHFPNYGIAADAEPCTHARKQAGNNPKTGKMVPVPIFPPRKVYSPSGLFTSSFRILSPTKRMRQQRKQHPPNTPLAHGTH